MFVLVTGWEGDVLVASASEFGGIACACRFKGLHKWFHIRLLLSPPLRTHTEDDMTPTMLAARRLARTLAQSRGFDAERLLSLVRRLLQEPKAQDLGLGIVADISERFVSRLIRSIFQLPESV